MSDGEVETHSDECKTISVHQVGLEIGGVLYEEMVMVSIEFYGDGSPYDRLFDKCR